MFALDQGVFVILVKARKMSCLVFQGSARQERKSGNHWLVPHFLFADARDEFHPFLL